MANNSELIKVGKLLAKKAKKAKEERDKRKKPARKCAHIYEDYQIRLIRKAGDAQGKENKERGWKSGIFAAKQKCIHCKKVKTIERSYDYNPKAFEMGKWYDE